jgi:hypothetical protein
MSLSAKKTILAVALLLVIMIVGFLLYRSQHSSGQLNVEPHAAQEIEKAKRR